MAIGPSTTQTPYIVSDEPNERFVSLLSVGDAVGFKPDGVTPWRMVGIPDGLGAFDNGDGTITVLMNHEIGNTQGVIREHGAIGSFVSELTIDKATLAVTHAEDAIKTVQLFDTVTDSYVPATTAFARFCSADLAAPGAFYDSESGLGTQAHIYLTGEETGAEGRPMAIVADGAEAGTAYELASLGNTSWENLVAAPGSGAKTVVIGQDDSTPGQLYVYVGDKQAAGSAIEQAGLVGGNLYGIKVDGLGIETASVTVPGGEASFTLASLGDVSHNTGAEIETASDTAGVTEFYRPEDGAWDPSHPNYYYFVTTGSFTDPSRLYRLEFNDVHDPASGGTIKLLLDGSEGQRMLDNITVDGDGKLILQEDPGNQPHVAKLWSYDPTTDALTQVGEHDPARFATPTAPFNQDEESSGVVDVTGLLGDGDTKAYLLDVQAHYTIADPELVQGGQVVAMFVDTPHDGTGGDDVLKGGAGVDKLSGFGGNDEILGGSSADRLDGGAGNDNLVGGRGDDRLDGKSGSDTLTGDAGKDQLYGGTGDDRLIGGEGADRLYGGAGADSFVFGSPSDSTPGSAGRDSIFDFNGAQGDRIDVSALGDLSFTNAFHGVAGELIAVKSGGYYLVKADLDGDKVTDFAVHVHSGAALTASDFIF